jgi:hypothetical protein
VIAFQGGDQKGKRVELVFAGDQRFVRQVGTRQWIKAPPQESATQSTDLESSLRYLSGVTDDVQRLGSERVRGVSTVRYSATVDLDKVADSLPDDERDAYRKQTQQLQTKTLPVELWIDDAHRLRRLTYGLDLKRLGVSEPGLERLDFTAELYDFGEPAPIRVPTGVGG